MFTSARLPFSAAVKQSGKFAALLRSRYLWVAAFVTVLLLGVAQPAQAAQGSVVKAADAPNFMCYIGSPTLDVFNPARDASQKVTGIILGVFLLGTLIAAAIGGAKIAFAGKSASKSADGVAQVSNALKGVTITFAVLFLFGVVVTVLLSIIPFAC